MTKICVVGLGYVGLPLAVEFAKEFPTLGFDVSEKRIAELKQGKDSTNEVEDSALQDSKLECTTDPSRIKECDFIIVAVPTPINDDFRPDLKYVESASEIVGKNMAAGSIVVYESTVYPGLTEEVCLPILEKGSDLRCGEDFKIGYSPERINPGDKEHTVRKIVKVVAGMDKESTGKIAEVYGKVIDAGVYKAKDIKTAEAAKVIENTQRDLNIALVNELSLIFGRLGINTKDVIDAAATKWNFQKFYPGLVGGHCIGVDPYYLTYKAEQTGYNPKVILAGRSINEYMSEHVVRLMEDALKEKGAEAKKVLVLGLTFKENVPDIRNSKAKDIIAKLKEKEYEVIAHDPIVEEDVEKKFGEKNVSLDEAGKADAVILLTAHEKFREITLGKLKDMLNNPVLIDVKSFYSKEEAEKEGFAYRNL